MSTITNFNAKHLANSARTCANLANSVSGTIKSIVLHWNLSCQVVDMTDFIIEANYSRRAVLAADLLRMATRLDNLAAGLTADGQLVLNEEDASESIEADKTEGDAPAAEEEAAHAATFGEQVRQVAAQYGVQIRFAALMAATGDYKTKRRGAELIAFISDAKTAYKAAHPDMLTGGDVIVDHDHFTAFILGDI